uniref:Uncharacterized protein n=1 Tax=Denticeps clupeoides TaxID=299321 RepID=A0AAY4EKW0_9TELE
MRKLNLSERRDSFKKQEAVQEVSFDEPDDKVPGTQGANPGSSTPSGSQARYAMQVLHIWLAFLFISFNS